MPTPRRISPLTLTLMLTLTLTAHARHHHVISRDLTFFSRDAKLYGTLLLPPGQGPFPAVLLLPGPGSLSRHEDQTAAVPLQQEIAERLAALGVATLRYDRRGAGRSLGQPQPPLALRRADAGAALSLLRATPEIDGRRLLVCGASEAALGAAALAAEDPGLRGLVLISAPARPGAAVMDAQRHAALSDAGVPPEQVRAIDELQARVYQAARTGVGWDHLPPEVRERADTPYFREIIDYDPLPVLSRVRQPVLVLHGAADRQIPPADAQATAQALRRAGNPAVRLVIVPGADHRLAHPPDRHVAPEALSALAAFVHQTVP